MSKNTKTIGKKSVASESDESSHQQVAAVTLKPKDIDPVNFEISDFNTTGKQAMAYINYHNSSTNIKSKVLVQLGKIKLVAHGIPNRHPEYVPSDANREFIELPLDPEQKSCVELEEMCRKIDDHFSSDETKAKLFGKKKADSFVYSPLIKLPKVKDDDDDDDEEDSKKKKKTDKKAKPDAPRYAKVRIGFSFRNEDEDTRVCSMKLIEVNKEVKLNTVTEIAERIRYRSEVQLIIRFLKVWQNKSVISGTNNKLYGVKLQAMAIRYYPLASNAIKASDIEFVDEEDNDGDASPQKPVVKTIKNAKVDDADQDQADVDSQDDQSDAEDSDAPQKKTPVKGSKADVDSDAEDSDTPSKKKPAKKTSKKIAVDSDDESDDAPPKKSTKKSSKKAVVESDNEESEEEVKPRKKVSRNK